MWISYQRNLGFSSKSQSKLTLCNFQNLDFWHENSKMSKSKVLSKFNFHPKIRQFLTRKFNNFQGWNTLKNSLIFDAKNSNMSKSKALSKLIFFWNFLTKNPTFRIVCSFCVAVFLNFFSSFCCFVKWLKFCN